MALACAPDPLMPGHIPIPRQEARWPLLFLFGILASFGHIFWIM